MQQKSWDETQEEKTGSCDRRQKDKKVSSLSGKAKRSDNNQWNSGTGNREKTSRVNAPSEPPHKAEVATPDTPFATGTEEAEKKKKRKDETNKEKDEDPARVYINKQPKENTQLPKKMRKDKKREKERDIRVAKRNVRTKKIKKKK